MSILDGFNRRFLESAFQNSDIVVTQFIWHLVDGGLVNIASNDAPVAQLADIVDHYKQ